MQFAIDLTIDRPVEEVFDYACDLERVPEWAEPALEREKLTDGPIRTGTRYRSVDRVPGRRIEFIEEVTTYQPHELFVMTMGEPFNAQVSTSFEESDAGTRVSFMVDTRPGGMMGILGPLLTRPMKRMFENDLTNLKATLEASN